MNLRLGPPLGLSELRGVERDLHLRLGKWDTQVGDTPVLSSQPLVFHRQEWSRLCAAAERLAAELCMEEQNVLATESLQSRIGIPKPLRPVLGRLREQSARTMRALRFDFHPTSEGWRISEVNSDVPGGWGEAESLPALFQRYYPDLVPSCSPLRAWGEAVARLADGGCIALLSAPGFLEDQQVTLAFQRELSRRAVRSVLLQNPAALRVRQPRISVLVRFYQIEWLCKLSRRTNWPTLLTSADFAVVNPAVSLISESKRFPLAFSKVAEDSAWAEFAPESRDPREVSANDWDNWVLKAAYSNTGDQVYLCSELSKGSLERLLQAVRRDPLAWVAQRRFHTIPLDSVRGPVFPCVGVFVVNGRAAGAYVRLSRRQVTDGAALEAPLMMDRIAQ